MPYGMDAIQRSVSGSGQYAMGGARALGDSGTRILYKGQGDKKKPGKKGGIPSIESYLGGDADYKATLDALRRNFEQTKIQNVTNRGNLSDDYNLTNTRLQQDQDKSLAELQADYAARGLLGSGLSAKAANDQAIDYQKQFGDAQISYDRNLGQLVTDLANARSQFREDKTQARLNAIRRRAEKYGIRS